jgi:hypothetical protein
MKTTLARWICGLALLALVAPASPATAREAALATMSADTGEVTWAPQVAAERFVLTVALPDGSTFRREFESGKNPVFGLFDQGQTRPDGVYRFELQAVPRLSAEQKRALVAARERGADALAAEQKRAGLADRPSIQSGSFTVENGSVVVAGQAQEPASRAAAAKAGSDSPDKDNVIADDLIVQGSACVGLDCVNNESFGFDTIRLKENNTRIKFDDTSTGAFPANDWQLTANDSASGGSNKFSIEDVTGSLVPFTLTAGAPTNAIFVDSSGRVGFRTSTPVLDLHISTGNTPAMRMEQTSAGGFTAQTWDVAGNEANFFVRDVTGGSRLPFRIRPGAPTSSIDINASGLVGVGTASPSTQIHVRGTGVTGASNTTKILVENASTTNGSREMLELRNNGGSVFVLSDTNLGARWAYGQEGTDFVMDRQGVGSGAEFRLTSAGNLTVSGTVTGSSSRTVKENFAAVDAKQVLSRVLALPISQWSYKAEEGKTRHMGPMAEDFFAAFGLGQGERTISMVDSDGVALAAIQGLYSLLQEKDSQIARVGQENAVLKSRLSKLEAMVGQLAAQAGAALTAKP